MAKEIVTLLDADTLKKLNANKQVLFRFCDEKGNTGNDANPNGTIEKYSWHL